MRKSLFAIATLLVLFFSGCLASAIPKQQSFKNIDKWLPPDFNPKKTTLLIHVITFPKGDQTKIADFMQANYPAKYEFVTNKMMKDSIARYADKSIYRFEILSSSDSYNMAAGVGTQGMNISLNDFFFYDRLNNKRYQGTNKPSSYPAHTFIPMMQSILDKFW